MHIKNETKSKQYFPPCGYYLPHLAIYGTSPIGNTLPITKTTVYNNRVRGLYCKLRRSFYRSDLWPKHEAHMHKSERKKTRGVTCRSLGSNGRGRAVKYGPLNWPIMAHVLTERYNNLQQVSYWLPPACLEKVLFGEQPFLQDTGKNNTGHYWNGHWAWLIVHCNTVQIPW